MSLNRDELLQMAYASLASYGELGVLTQHGMKLDNYYKSPDDNVAALHLVDDRGDDVIAFKGTSSWDDILYDIDFSKAEYYTGKVANGFLKSSRLLDKWVERNIKSGTSFTGHSLGGAIATIFNCRYNRDSVTFASPRVGDEDFVNGYDKNIGKTKRIWYTYDPVPHLPFKDLGYKHVEVGYEFFSNGTYKRAVTNDRYVVNVANHRIDKYIEVISKMSESDSEDTD